MTIHRTYFILLLSLFASFYTQAGEALCRTNDHGVSYCKYAGKLNSVYINSDNTVMAYFEDEFNVSHTNLIGADKVYSKAAAILDTGNNDAFLRNTFNLLLQAKANDRKVVIHMRKKVDGLMIIDRVWMQ